MTIGDVDEKPPETLRLSFKKYQKLPPSALEQDEHIVDFQRGLLSHQQPRFSPKSWLNKSQLYDSFGAYVGKPTATLSSASENISAFESKDIPGLVVLPNLLPLDVQRSILDKTLYRDLVNPAHKTTLHLNYEVKYPPHDKSFFDLSPSSTEHFSPRDPSLHRAATVQQVLEKKLKWMTLGGQYDWSNKLYPHEAPPPFPADLQKLLLDLFPDTTAEAAIVNIYSPGSVLRPHQDVSEFCDRGLISLSIGCDGLFMLALGAEGDSDDPWREVILRLHSGDAVYMTGRSRYAWHGVPVILANTCPKELQAWPCRRVIPADPDGTSQLSNEWCGWLSRKRININVRQMFDGTNTSAEP